MTVFGMVRLSHEEIKRIIAEHMAAKYGGSADVGIWPEKDSYGNEIRATVTFRNPDDLYRGPASQMDNT